MTCTSSSCRTVTGTCRPSAWNRRVIPTFFAITPVRMIKTPQQRHPNHFGCVQPIQMFACPAWASAPLKGAAGTQPGASLRRYPPFVRPVMDGWPSGQLDFYVDARSQIEFHQSIDRLRGWLHDIEQPLVRPHLELLARLLVDVRRPVDGELLDTRRKGNGSADESTGAACRIGDIASRLVQHSMI